MTMRLANAVLKVVRRNSGVLVCESVSERRTATRASALFVLYVATAITLPGQTFSLLYSFSNGEHPQAGLVQATNGDLYGTTPGGGANNAGTIFKLTPNGTLKTVYSFCSQNGCIDGGSPLTGLVRSVGGDFYGTTSGGGANQKGTVFRVTLQGKLTTLYSLCSISNCADGAGPNALVLAASGEFYGTTVSGGANRRGTFFRITPAGKLISHPTPARRWLQPAG